MANADALGQFILLSNPYTAKASPTPFPSSGPPPVLPPLPNLDLLYGLCLSESESQEYSGHWDFRGTAHFVKRALRIPYMYYRPEANGGSTLVTDYLLIGFEGGAGP